MNHGRWQLPSGWGLKAAYRCLLPLIALAFMGSVATAQGTLTNGWMHLGVVGPGGDVDTWNFTANAGDRIVLRVGEITQTNNFTPRLRLTNPASVLQATATGASAAEIAVTATNSGTFTVSVDGVAANATASYRLTLAKSPGVVEVAPGDEGGPLTNGIQNSGTTPVGDLDLWTFSANAGDSVVLRMGAATYNPWIRLYGPDGVLAGQAFDGSSGVRDADLRVQLTNSGPYTVVVGSLDGNAGGSYILTLALAPAAISVSAGDQGGPMTNGVRHTGTLEIGDLDVWSFSANTGDAIVLRMGSVGYNPWIRLFGPNGVMVGQAADGSSGVRDADLRIQATNSGMFTVVVGSWSQNGKGDYILTLAHAPEAITVSPGDQGGPMTNGVQHTGTLDIGDLDVWSFSANTGDAIVLRMGSVGYNPWIRLFGPNGVMVGQAADGSSGVRDADLRIQATNSGVFTVVVGSWSQNGKGDYILTLAHAPEAITVSPGDQGGPMTNAVQHTGTLDIGDLDVWSFSANAGDAIVLRMGSTSYNPWIRLFGPDGVMVGQAADGSSGVRDADLRIQATNSGIFTVVIGSWSQNGKGDYILTLAHAPEAITISPGDQGGPMTNAVQHTGTLETGDLDVWSFSANTGDAIVLRMGSTGYNPWIRLFGPDGVLLASAADGSSGVRDVEARTQATNSGIFTVVAGSWSQNGKGPYILTLAHVPEAITVSPDDQGGALSNGFQHPGVLEVGDLDLWSFNAVAGDSVALRIGAKGAFNPWIRLYSPTGVLLAQGVDGSSGIRDGNLRIQVTNSGTFTVLIGSWTQNGTGSYILSLGRAPAEIFVAPGDQGGSITNGMEYTGTIDVGDLDLWQFPACRASQLKLVCTEVTGGNAFSPRLRLFGPAGNLIATVAHATSAVINHEATASGMFTVIVDGAGDNHTGTYKLTATGLADYGFELCPPLITSAGVLDITGIGGTPGAEGVLFHETNLDSPLANWEPVYTNRIDRYGVIVRTNAFNRAESNRSFILLQR